MTNSGFVKLSYSHSPELARMSPSLLTKKSESISAFCGNKREVCLS